MYLRDVGVVGQAEADAALNASLTRAPRTSVGDNSLVRSSVLMFSVLLAAGVFTGGAIQAAAGRFSPSDDTTQSGSTLSLSRAGYLRVVAEPWADVFVDGELVATTPSATRIPLAPGRHFVKLANPFYQDHMAEVVIKSGETQMVEAALKPKHAALLPDAIGPKK
jgi:hypothetical protein